MIDTIHNFPFLGLFTSFGWQEIIILLVIGVLIFGKRLPEVGKNFGKSIVEFKKGIKGVGDEIDAEATKSSEISEKTTADLPPAKVTPDPVASEEKVEEIEEVERPLDD
ncbi:twin-arginine translocase TatA/TatE family subunit [PVC group bacterium]|nr:twin-arginine translocase TatA/TatE family subunit [PVC group bacterium]